MTENATTDPNSDSEPMPAAPVAESRADEAVASHALEGAELQDPIVEQTACVPETHEPEAPPAPVAGTPAEPATEPEPLREVVPEVVATVSAAEPPAVTEEAPTPAKKPRAPRAPKVAATVAPAAIPDVAGTSTEAPVHPKPEIKKKWYAIKVQSGREDTIKAAILRKVAIEGLEDVFGQIMIPFEEVIEKKTVKVKDKKTGETTTQEKKVTRKKKKFQGYLFAELEFNDRMLYLFRETSGVGDFLNLRTKPGEAPTPEPMPDHEVLAMLTGVSVKPGGPAKKVKLEFEKGDRVRIREGSFANSEGEVTVISEPKDPTDAPKITVVVTFWGRPLPVELEYWQVAKV